MLALSARWLFLGLLACGPKTAEPIPLELGQTAYELSHPLTTDRGQCLDVAREHRVCWDEGCEGGVCVMYRSWRVGISWAGGGWFPGWWVSWARVTTPWPRKTRPVRPARQKR